jgi:hypothetical protein
MYSAAVLVAATAWLIATAWLHLRLARSRSMEQVASRRLFENALCDLAVAVIAAVLLLKGHTLRLALAGLWIVPPTLLAAAVSSAGLLLYATLSARGQPSAPAPRRFPVTWLDWRTASLLAMIVALVLLERQPLPEL